MGYPDMMRDLMEQVRGEETKKKKNDLENLSIIDNATGLYNRRYFHLRLDQEMTRSKLHGNNLSLIFLDVGRYSQEDHKMSHPESRQIKKVISEIISICLTDTIDLAFSYDKYKFAIILPEVNYDEATNIVKRIQKMAQKEKPRGINLHVAVVQYNNHTCTEELITSVLNALAAKKNDTNRND